MSSTAAITATKTNEGLVQHDRYRSWKYLASGFPLALILCLLAVVLSGTYAIKTKTGRPLASTYIQYFEDSKNQLEFRDLRRVPFRPATQDAWNVGYSGSTHWLKIDASAFRQVPRPRYLSIANADAQELTLFVPGISQREPAALQQLGIAIPVDRRPTPYPVSVFDLQAIDASAPHVFLRLRSNNSLYIQPILYSQTELVALVQKNSLQLGLILGCLLLTVIICAYCFWLTRDVEFFWLMVSAPLLFLFEASSKEFAHIYLWNYFPYWSSRATAVLVGLFLAGFAMLVASAFQLKATFPRLQAACMVVAALGVVTAVLVLLPVGYMASVALLHLVCFAGATLFVLCGIASMWSGTAGATIYTSMQLLYCVIVYSRIVESSGLDTLPQLFVPIFSSDLLSFGSVALCGLSLHIAFDQNARKQLAARRFQKDILKDMEAQVLTRTMELNNTVARVESNAEQQRYILATMSHELRSPLSAVIGMTALLRRDRTVASDAKKDIATIERLARQLLTIVDDGLAYARGSDRKELTGGSEVVFMPDFVRDMKSVSDWMASHHDNAFVNASSSDIPTFLEFHEQAVRQILINLITNAGRYCTNGVVTTRFEFVGAPGVEGSHLILQVFDTGQGIHPSKIKAIFDPFAKSKDSVGLGLGLAIVRTLVESCGGSIDVSSKQRVGTVFTVKIPARLAEPPVHDSELTTKPIAFDYAEPRLLEGEHIDVFGSGGSRPDTAGLHDLAQLDELQRMASNGLYSEMETWLVQARRQESAGGPWHAFLDLIESHLRRLDFSSISNLIAAKARRVRSPGRRLQDRLSPD